MWAYEKKLQFPIDIKKKDLKMAKNIITQLGKCYYGRYNK